LLVCILVFVIFWIDSNIKLQYYNDSVPCTSLEADAALNNKTLEKVQSAFITRSKKKFSKSWKQYALETT